MTPDQRYSVRFWDHGERAWREQARAYAVQALPPGELSEVAIEDIARYCDEELVHDEYATKHVQMLRDMYRSSPGAKSTKGASDVAFHAAFVAGGLVPDTETPNCFNVREADDEGLTFVSDDDTRVEPAQWIVPGLIPTGCQVVFVGDQASGKTSTVASLLAAVAHGRAWLGRPTERSQCAIVNFDGRDSDLRQLLHEAGSDGNVGIASYPEHNLSSDCFWQALEKRFGNGRPAIIGVDSISRGSGDVDEKDARFAAPILRAAELSARYPITFVWLHHTPVTVRGNGINDWLRGTSALGAAFDIGFGFSKVSSSASPRETILRVQTLKMRPKGLLPPAPFKLRITNAGLALYDETRRKAPLTDDEKVLAVVMEKPGITSAVIEAEVDIRRALAQAARRRLDEAGVIENRGSPKKPRWFAT